MKKFFSYITIVFAALLLTGCANNTVAVSNDEVIKFDGGAVNKTEAYSQLIATAGYDTTFTLVKSILTQVDMQLLEKDTALVAKVKEETVNKQYDELMSQAGGDTTKAFQAMTQQFGVSVTNEQEAKRFIRYTQLVEQRVIEKGSSDSEVEKMYEQKYGEKVSVKYALMNDQSQAAELQKELSAGTIKLEDIVTKYTEFQQSQQQAAQQQAQQPTFKFNDKYTISAVIGENENALAKKTGVFKSDDEAVLFQHSNKDTWLPVMELQNTEATNQTNAPKQYLVVSPYKYADATKSFDDAVKEEVKSDLSKSKLQDAKEVEKIMRDYRKEKGFEITDSQLKKAFDAYQKSIDTPTTSTQGQGSATA